VSVTVSVNGVSGASVVATNGDVIGVNVSAAGATGAAGPANSLAIGTVTTGTAAATITGTAPSQTLNLVLPAGGASLSDATPAALGTAAAGTSSTASRSDHVHSSPAISGVTGLQAALDAKQAAGSYAAASHTHTASQITDRATALVTSVNGMTGAVTVSGGSGGTDARFNLFLPPAPTSVTASAGNTQASVAWTAPTVLAQTPITDYTIQYSTDGTNWTTFTRSASTSASGTVTGLTNGTAYTFRVAGVSGIGTGNYSTSSASVTPGGGTFRAIPTLTSATSSGEASASAILASGLDAWRAFDKATVTSDSTFYGSPSPSTGSWIQYDFGAGVTSTVGGYTITSRYLAGYGDSSDSGSQAPKSWTLSGSSDGSSFTVIDTRASTQAFTYGQTRTFTLSSSATYRVFRWTWTSEANGGAVVIPKIQLV
jgi:hypothetical protein